MSVHVLRLQINTYQKETSSIKYYIATQWNTMHPLEGNEMDLMNEHGMMSKMYL